MDLYIASLIVNNLQWEWYLVDNVKICLFYGGDETRYSEEEYSQLIENYDPNYEDILAPKDAIDEFFTKEQIDQMGPFFRNLKDAKFHFRKLKLPISLNTYPLCSISVGRYDLMVRYRWWEDYPLDFEVWGLYFITPGRDKMRVTDASVKIYNECVESTRKELKGKNVDELRDDLKRIWHDKELNVNDKGSKK